MKLLKGDILLMLLSRGRYFKGLTVREALGDRDRERDTLLERERVAGVVLRPDLGPREAAQGTGYGESALVGCRDEETMDVAEA